MHEESVTITLSPQAAQFMLELVKSIQLSANDPNLVTTAASVVEIRDQITNGLSQEQPHEH